MSKSCNFHIQPDLMAKAESFIVPKAQNPFRVVVAMSGGVDSAVAAWLLKEAGHDVIGVSLKLSKDTSRNTNGRCCSVDDLTDARLVCDKLGIPFYAIDSTDRFYDTVFKPFVEAYPKGQTPIPCLACNYDVKFGDLYKTAQSLGARLATGHYVQKTQFQNFSAIKRPLDDLKDQTYYLYGLSPEIVANLEFPLGDLRKPFVRALAKRMGLSVHAKPDSHEICFVPDGNHARVVEKAVGPLPKGTFVNLEGKVLGQNEGIHHFTVGQRRGLGIGFGQRSYVVDIDPKSHRVVLGQEKDLQCTHIGASSLNCLIPFEHWPQEAWVQVRARNKPLPARLALLMEGHLDIYFQEPTQAVSLGQAAVIYTKEGVLLGGGIIHKRLDGVAPR